jgi:hypothetical protein
VCYCTVKTVLSPKESTGYANIRRFYTAHQVRRIFIIYSGGYRKDKKAVVGNEAPAR